MFGLIRLIVLCAIAFVTGVLYERHNVTQACTAIEGHATNGLCLVRNVSQ